jgi:peptidoglycan hydrolase-like protein with peptidoglycan-binding domain
MRTLHLTSPHTSGRDVRELQSLLVLRGHLSGRIDGEYGPVTAQAVYRAKYWLGYASRNVDHSAGALLVSFLNRTRQPTLAMKARQALRLRRRAERPLRVKALENLSAHLGAKEFPPNSNRVSWASEWYGVIGPWCAMAVTRAYVDAGSKAFERAKRYAYCPFIVADARAGRNNLTLASDPKPGDLVLYDWDRDGVADHVGLFERWRSFSEFDAIEGNTAVGNDSNGGEVMRRTRTRSLVIAFVHVGK